MIKNLSKVDFKRINNQEHVLKMREIKHDLKGEEQDQKIKELEDEEEIIDAPRTFEYYQREIKVIPLV